MGGNREQQGARPRGHRGRPLGRQACVLSWVPSPTFTAVWRGDPAQELVRWASGANVEKQAEQWSLGVRRPHSGPGVEESPWPDTAPLCRAFEQLRGFVSTEGPGMNPPRAQRARDGWTDLLGLFADDT